MSDKTKLSSAELRSITARARARASESLEVSRTAGGKGSGRYPKGSGSGSGSSGDSSSIPPAIQKNFDSLSPNEQKLLGQIGADNGWTPKSHSEKATAKELVKMGLAEKTVQYDEDVYFISEHALTAVTNYHDKNNPSSSNDAWDAMNKGNSPKIQKMIEDSSKKTLNRLKRRELGGPGSGRYPKGSGGDIHSDPQAAAKAGAIAAGGPVDPKTSIFDRARSTIPSKDDPWEEDYSSERQRAGAHFIGGFLDNIPEEDLIAIHYGGEIDDDFNEKYPEAFRIGNEWSEKMEEAARKAGFEPNEYQDQGISIGEMVPELKEGKTLPPYKQRDTRSDTDRALDVLTGGYPKDADHNLTQFVGNMRLDNPQQLALMTSKQLKRAYSEWQKEHDS